MKLPQRPPTTPRLIRTEHKWSQRNLNGVNGVLMEELQRET